MTGKGRGSGPTQRKIEDSHPVVFDRLASEDEAALFEDTPRCGVVLGNCGVERALGHLRQEERERSRGDSQSPVRPADPIANLARLRLTEADEVANHLPI